MKLVGYGVMQFLKKIYNKFKICCLFCKIKESLPLKMKSKCSLFYQILQIKLKNKKMHLIIWGSLMNKIKKQSLGSKCNMAKIADCQPQIHMNYLIFIVLT